MNLSLPSNALVLVVGMLLAGGLWAIGYGLRRTPPRLSDALERLDGTEGSNRQFYASEAGASPSERLGLWVLRNSPIQLLPYQARLLELKRKPVAEFCAEKIIFALLGAGVPAVSGGLAVLVLDAHPAIPGGGSLLGLLLGFFAPDLLLARSAQRSRADAGEALFTFFDLVTLERLANHSASQSLHSAAELSDNPLFVSIRTALLRARLEQQPPYAELKRLADRLRLPELTDIADVMQLDESGAALSGALRARVRELRDAHLTEAKMAAHDRSERMTLFMALPAMIFGVIYLVPPLLRLAGG